MNKKVKLIFTCLFSICTLNSFAQDMVLSCDDAIRIALQESYSIQTYDNARIMRGYWYAYNKAMFKPRLDMGIYAPSWTEQVHTIERADDLPVYNSTGSMRIGGNLNFTYPLPTGGNFSLSSNSYYEDLHTILALQDDLKLKNKLVYNSFQLSFSQPVFTKNTLKENLYEAELSFEKVTKQYTRGQMDIIHDVTMNFYALYRATKLVEITEQRLANSREALRVAFLKSESGLIPEGDLLTMEVQVAEDEADLFSVKAGLERHKDRFKHLIGLDLNMDIRIHVELILDDILIDRDLAINEALSNRLELEEAALDVQLQEIEVDRAKRTKEVKGSIEGFYNFIGISTLGNGGLDDLYSSSFSNIGKRPPNRGIMFTLSIPIVDWGRSRALVSQAKIGLNDKELRLNDMKTTIVKEVRDIVRTVEESKNRLAIHEKNQELAQRSYNIYILKYENGDISNQELALERERLASVQLNYLDAYIDYKLAVSDLKRKTMWDFENNRSYKVNWTEKN